MSAANKRVFKHFSKKINFSNLAKKKNLTPNFKGIKPKKIFKNGVLTLVTSFQHRKPIGIYVSIFCIYLIYFVSLIWHCGFPI